MMIRSVKRLCTTMALFGMTVGMASGTAVAASMAGSDGMQMGAMPKDLPKAGKPIAFAAAQPLIEYSNSAGVRMGHGKRRTVMFKGQDIHIVMVAVEPGFPDQTFEIHRLADPVIAVSAGAKITLTLLNMDYGGSMVHGVVIGKAKPPYKTIVPVPVAGQIAEIPLTMPRTSQSLGRSGYFVGTTTFKAPQFPGRYYYFCQMPEHAKSGMYGQFVVMR